MVLVCVSRLHPAGSTHRQPPALSVYILDYLVYTGLVAKHLIDIDENALKTARTTLQTGTIKETVNEALRRSGTDHAIRVKQAIDVLAGGKFAERDQAWR